MTNRVVSVELRALVSNYVAGFKQAAQATTDLADKAGKKLTEHSAEVSKMGTGFAIAGAGMIAVAAKAVKTYADFDKAMSGVAATGEDAKASLSELRAVAIKLGADTQYSAQEAADGITNLLKAGVSAKDVIGGGLAGTLNLAAAGELGVADAAEIAATALGVFGLKGSDMSHVADLLAAGAGKAQGEVTDLAAALKYVGPVAAGMGVSIEETVGTLAAFAEQGILADQAGTGLRGVLMSMTSPSAEARKEMDRLGISLYDGQGQFLGLTNLAGQLGDAYGDMSSQTRDASLGIIFGNAQVTAARVLFTNGAEGVKKWTEAVNDQGYAARQAAELTNNLSGDVERLGGSLDSVFIKSGSGANNVLRRMVQGAEAAVDAFGGLPEPLLSTMTLLTGAGGIATLGVGGLLKLASAAADAKANFKALGLSASTAKLAVGGVGAALALGTLALTAWASSAADAEARTQGFVTTLALIDGKAVTTQATMAELVRQLTETKTGMLAWAGVGPTVADNLDRMGISSGLAAKAIMGQADAQEELSAKMRAWAAQNRDVHGNDPQAYYETKSAIDALAGGLDNAKNRAEQKAKADEDAAGSAGNLSSALRDQRTGAESAATSIQKVTEAIYGLQDANLAITGSQVGFEQAIDDSAEAVQKLVKATKDKADLQNVDKQAGRDAIGTLTKLASATNSYAKEQIKQGKSESEITATMARGRKAFADRARDLGFSEQKISELIDKYLQVPENVTTDVNEEGAEGARSRVVDLFNAIKKLPKSEQTKILSEFNDKGIDAANKALNKINGKTATTTVVTKYKAMKMEADGGILAGVIQSFAGGGTWGQPQVRPFQGSAGVNWGEAGSGPWEAFISGAPQKRDRSIAIWREVGRRLLGSFSAEDLVQGFASGGIAEPTHNGKPLSYWQDKLKTPLELTRLQIEIRDLKADLAEKETYYTGKGKKRKKKKRDKLRGLDRTEAQQQLAEAEADYADALEAQKLDKSDVGTIEQQVEAYKAASEKADEIRQLADQIGKFDLGSALSGGGSWTKQTDINGNTFYTGSAGGSAAAVTAAAQARAAKIKAFTSKLGELAKLGMAPAVLADIFGKGVDEGTILADAYLSDTSQIAGLNAAYADIGRYSSLAGQTVTAASSLAGSMPDAGAQLADAFLARIEQALQGRVIEPSLVAGYAVSGAAGPAVYTQTAQTITYAPVIHYPQAVPSSVQQNIDLQFLSAMGAV